MNMRDKSILQIKVKEKLVSCGSTFLSRLPIFNRALNSGQIDFSTQTHF